MATPAMVPMLSPDGASGDIPQANVEAALKAGFKQAVSMTSPDGKVGYIPVDRQQDAMNAGFKPVAPADLTANTKSEGTYQMTGPKGPVMIPYSNVGAAQQQGLKFATGSDLSRYGKDSGQSLLQRAKNNFNFNTQGAQPGDGAVKGAVENVGQGGAQFIRGLEHPLDQAHAEVNAIESPHPLDRALEQAHTEVDALKADPSRFIGNAIGQVGTGAILAGAAGELAPKIPAGMKSAFDKFPTRSGAGQIFNKLNTDLAQQPVVLTQSAAPLQRAVEIGARGGTLPGPVASILQRSQAIEPMTFPEGRDYQASLSDLSASDKMAMNGRMKGAVAQLNHALYQDVRQAAEQGGGYGADFDKAMTQYRQASNIKNAVQVGGKAVVKGAIGAGLGAAGYNLVKDITANK